MSKKKILFISDTAARTGPTISLGLLLKYLRRDFNVAVLTSGRGEFTTELAAQGIQHFTLPNLRKWAIPHIYRILRRERIDIVYGNSAGGGCRNALIAAKLAHIPYIWHIREMVAKYPFGNTIFFRFADKIIAVSKACAEDIAYFTAKENVTVIYNGIDIQATTISRQEGRAHLIAETGAPDDTFFILHVGHVYPRKGQLQALEAFHLMQQYEVKKPVHLVFLGNTERDKAYTLELQTRIADKSLQGTVSVLGFRRDAIQLLAGADLLLHTPSADPHPRVVIESMSLGVPVVSFAVDGVVETVLDNVTGLLVPPRDIAATSRAVVRLVNGSEGVKFGLAAKEHVQNNFLAEKTAASVAQIIRQLI